MLISQLFEGITHYPLAPRSEWYGDSDYKNNGGKLIYMSPRDFISKVRPLDMDETSIENVEHLKSHIRAGKTLDPLVMSKNGKEDGRHRAYAAMQLGITKIPVIVY